jgi:anti-anti-sigma factor
MSVSSNLSSDGGTVTIAVRGRFDFSTHQDFLKVYTQHPKGEKHFVVDLEQAEYMDSSAMGMLLQLRDYSDKGGAVSLVNGNDGIKEILRIANFDKLFDIA